MEFSQMTCNSFADALAAKTPVPGGGGASALVGALGAALGSMVGAYTVGKPKYAAVEGDVLAVMEELAALRGELLSLVEADAAAFAPLSRAYAIPAEDPQRPAVMEQCLRRAAAVPMQMLRLSCRCIVLHRELGEKGSALMLSDVGTGVIFAWAALYGAALNVKVNTKLMADRAYAGEVNRQVDELVEEHWKIAEQVYEKIYGRYC